MSIQSDYNNGYGGYRPNSQTSSKGPNQFRELGHPGKYTAVRNLAASTNASFTGSKWGGAAVMFGPRTGHSGAGADLTKIFFSGGGMVTLRNLGAASGSLYEFSIKEIHNGAGGTVTVFSKGNSGIGAA